MKQKHGRFLTLLAGFILLSMLVSLVLTGLDWVNGTDAKGKASFLFIEIIAGIIVLIIPFILERWFKFIFPTVLIALYLLFIYCSIYLGTIYHFYNIPYWDKFLHLMSAMLLGGLGYTIFGRFVKGSELTKMSPFLMSFFAFCFGLSIGVFWEFYEYIFDGLLGLDMQRFREGGVLLKGRAALWDTMTDLFADAGGSALIAIIGYFGIKSNPKWLENLLFRSTKSKKE